MPSPAAGGGLGRLACQMATILLVCTGNICRSPMAEGLLRRELEQRDIRDMHVESTGVSGWEGSPPTPEAVEAISEYGLDISGHSARRLTRPMVEGADLVVAMSSEHRDAVARLVPAGESRTFTIKELVHLLESSPQPAAPDGSPTQRLRAAVRTASALRGSIETHLMDEDIADPLGLGVEAYRATAWELEGLSRRLVEGLFPGAGHASVTEEGGVRGSGSPGGGAG
jgi:low molecular weight protein-tyrosine phosphatase